MPSGAGAEVSKKKAAIGDGWSTGKSLGIPWDTQLHGWATDWNTAWLTAWMSEWMNERMNEWMNQRYRMIYYELWIQIIS